MPIDIMILPMDMKIPVLFSHIKKKKRVKNHELPHFSEKPISWQKKYLIKRKNG